MCDVYMCVALYIVLMASLRNEQVLLSDSQNSMSKKPLTTESGDSIRINVVIVVVISVT